MPYFLHFLHQCVADCNFPLKHFYHLSETKLRDFAPFHGRSVGRSVIDASGESFIPCFLYLCCSCEIHLCICVFACVFLLMEFMIFKPQALVRLLILSPAKPNFAVATSDCARCGSGMCISDRLGSLPFPRPLLAALEVESSEDAIKQPIPGWLTWPDPTPSVCLLPGREPQLLRVGYRLMPACQLLAPCWVERNMKQIGRFAKSS